MAAGSLPRGFAHLHGRRTLGRGLFRDLPAGEGQGRRGHDDGIRQLCGQGFRGGKRGLSAETHRPEGPDPGRGALPQPAETRLRPGGAARGGGQGDGRRSEVPGALRRLRGGQRDPGQYGRHRVPVFRGQIQPPGDLRRRRLYHRRLDGGDVGGPRSPAVLPHLAELHRVDEGDPAHHAPFRRPSGIGNRAPTTVRNDGVQGPGR